VEQAYARGLKRFDFMLGDEPYKARWTTEERQTVNLVIGAPTLRGQAAFAALVGAQAARRRARSSPFLQRARRHWLGRAWSEILDYDEWWAQRRTWPDGCPKTWDVPPARHYTHPTAGRIVVWPDGSLEGYGPDGKRKHLNPAATAARLESGYGQWRETWFDHTGTEIKPAWVKAICKAAGVTYP
jgi:hypothetical protein